jgi:hypothetical protein
MPPKVKVCPCCGAERKPPTGFVETEDGVLVPLNREVAPVQATLAVKQLWYSGLLGFAQERGYAQGWAWHKYREKFGVYPPPAVSKVVKPPTDEIRSWVKSRQIAFAKAKEAANAA